MTLRPQWRVSLAVLCVCLVALLSRQASAQASIPDASELRQVEDWVERAIAVDATLAGIEAEARALEHNAEALRANPFQPHVAYAGSPLPVESRQGPVRHQLSLSQTVPIGGYLGERSAPVLASLEALAPRAESRRLAIREEVVDALIQLWELEMEARVLAEQSEIYDDMLVHLGDAMVHGGTEYSDLLRMTLGSELLETRALAVEREEAEVRARIGVVLQAPCSELVLPEDIDSLVEVEGGLPSIGELNELARTRSPASSLSEAMAAASEASATSASRVLRPLPTFTAAWSVVGRYDSPLPGTGNGGADAFTIGVRVPIPTFRRHVSEEERAFEEEASAHRLEGEAELRVIEGELGAAVARFHEASEQLTRYDSTLLPLADDVVEALSSELLTGRREHTDYLLAFEQRLSMQIEVLELRAEAARAWWRIDARCAGALSERRFDGAIAALEASAAHDAGEER